MAFFKTIFGSKDSISKENFQWTPLDQAEQLDQLVKESKSQYVLIFKHSTRCGISRFSLQNFESEFKPDPSKVSLYFLDILNNRGLSNAVASRFDVVHQSPQVLLIRNTNIIYAESHGQISAEDLQSLIEGN
jgi:bacillithiol system protein YtxJ